MVRRAELATEFGGPPVTPRDATPSLPFPGDEPRAMPFGPGPAALSDYAEALTTAPRVVLFAIKPIFVQSILAGSKTVEIRRRFGADYEGCLALIYASAPTQALVGVTRILALHVDTPDSIVERFGGRAGASAHVLRAYLADCRRAHAIELAPPAAVPAVSLADLRRAIPGFRPPMNYAVFKASNPLLTLVRAANTPPRITRDSDESA